MTTAYTAWNEASPLPTAAPLPRLGRPQLAEDTVAAIENAGHLLRKYRTNRMEHLAEIDDGDTAPGSRGFEDDLRAYKAARTFVRRLVRRDKRAAWTAWMTDIMKEVDDDAQRGASAIQKHLKLRTGGKIPADVTKGLHAHFKQLLQVEQLPDHDTDFAQFVRHPS